MSTVAPIPTREINVSAYVWLLVALASVVVAARVQTGFAHMVEMWIGREEYSHALLIPFISAFLIWQRDADLRRIEIRGSWWGVALVAFGAALQAAGVLGTIDVVQQYGLLFMVYGLVLALLGFRAVRILWAPLLILAFMIPLPEFVLKSLSGQLQLISSQIGVWFIRLFGISVFVEGNVIDLGVYKLQVAEACDGLRYLFPLMTLGFIAAYMFNVSMWKRIVLFLSTIPITVLMNSLRIGTIGIMVEHWGTSMAEGFVHDFQGWAVFMVSTVLLLIEMMVLARLGGRGRHWRDVFGVDIPTQAPRLLSAAPKVSGPFVAGTVLVVALTGGIVLMPERAHALPQRELLLAFPTQIESWNGRRSALEQIYLDALKLDDYVIMDFRRSDNDLVNFYVAWYDSQQAGQSAHSPRSCLPGGGWHIADLRQIQIADSTVARAPLHVNRVEIELGNRRQLVYYWFQQRGRIITNEYLVKWYLFWDGLTRGRSDGALVRLVTPLRVGESMEAADRRLADFAGKAAARLERFVPN